MKSKGTYSTANWKKSGQEVNSTAFEVPHCYVPGVSKENNEKSGTRADIQTEIQCRNLLKVKLVVLALQV
jgi:hypothetical protein